MWPNKNPYIGAGGFCPLFRCFRVFDGRLVEEPVTARRWTSRSSSERLGLPHFLHTSDFCSQILRLRWQWQLKVPAALRVRFLRAARDLHAGCSACPDWSLQKLFKRGVPAQGESPAPRSWKRRATRSRRVVRRVCSELIMWYGKLTILDFETPFGRNRLARQEPSGRAGTVWPRGRNRSAARQEPFGLEAVAGAAPAGVRAGTARPLGGSCGRSRAGTARAPLQYRT